MWHEPALPAHQGGMENDNDRYSEPMMTTHDLAAYLAVTPRRIHDWRMRGDDMPPAYRIGGQLRWRPSEVRAWIDRQRAA